MRRLSRRTFLQTATAATLATQLKPSLPQSPTQTLSYPENGTLIPDDDWRLWIDEKAEWKSDPLFLPEDISWQNGVLCGKSNPLPVNEPTGGWGLLDHLTGINVTLPTTVEQHYWGKFGSRPYTPEEYRYAADDPIPQNGVYLGVSWWGKQIQIPAEWKDKRIFLHIRGARLRAEVFLNKKLVGYSIMEELPFECDLTHAADPGGFNLIAIRLTNPFGRYDWVDGLNAQWGVVKLYRSHGFAGLDRGMTISAHGDVRIKDVSVLNAAEPRTVVVNAEIESVKVPVQTLMAHLVCDLIDPATNKRLQSVDRTYFTVADQQHKATKAERAAIPSESLRPSSTVIQVKMNCKDAELWELDAPKLYYLVLNWKDDAGNTDTRTIAFGFRSFAPSGLGTNAIFRLNNRRIKLYSSISWGFWGLNGLFPTPELAEKEVTQAKKLNLNCLNFHRNLAKEEVLRAHDRLGLLRYMEPGAGKMAIGKLPTNVAGERSHHRHGKTHRRRRQIRPTLHVRQMRRDGQSLPLPPERHHLLPAKRNRRRPQKPRHHRHPRRHARRRPVPLHRPQRRLRRPATQGRAGMVRTMERQTPSLRRERMGRLVESTPGRRRPMVRRVLQIPDRLHL